MVGFGNFVYGEVLLADVIERFHQLAESAKACIEEGPIRIFLFEESFVMLDTVVLTCKSLIWFLIVALFLSSMCTFQFYSLREWITLMRQLLISWACTRALISHISL